MTALVVQLVVRVSGRVLHVADRLARRALCLVELALCLQLGIARETARGVLHCALRLIGRAFHMFLIHLRLQFSRGSNGTTPPARQGSANSPGPRVSYCFA